MLAQLSRNLIVGARLALFLPVNWRDFHAGGAQYATLVAFNLLMWIAFATLRDGQGQLNGVAIAIYLAQIPLLLLACLAIAAIYRNTATSSTIAGLR